MSDFSLSPLSADDLPFQGPVVLAPMAGVTDAPFRRQVMKFGAGLVYSEMIASQITIENFKKGRAERRLSHQDPFPCAVQIAGCDPDIMAQAAQFFADQGAPLIDINFGCPAKKVVNGMGGSALMRDLPLATKIMERVTTHVHVPVSIKMRLGWDHDSLNAPELARRAENAGVRVLTVHGRTRSQLYEGKADWSAVAKIKQAVHLPVFVNGDIRTPQDAKHALSLSGADGVMIARAAQGHPWILSQISSYLQEGVYRPPPSFQEIGQTIQTQYQDMLDEYGANLGNRIARKHIGWTLTPLPGGPETSQEINLMNDPNAVYDRLCSFFSQNSLT